MGMGLSYTVVDAEVGPRPTGASASKKSEFAARELRSVAERTKQTTVRFEDEPRCVELAVQVGYARHL